MRKSQGSYSTIFAVSNEAMKLMLGEKRDRLQLSIRPHAHWVFSPSARGPGILVQKEGTGALPNPLLTACKLQRLKAAMAG